jgi:hypothetical protein
VRIFLIRAVKTEKTNDGGIHRTENESPSDIHQRIPPINFRVVLHKPAIEKNRDANSTDAEQEDVPGFCGRRSAILEPFKTFVRVYDHYPEQNQNQIIPFVGPASRQHEAQFVFHARPAISSLCLGQDALVEFLPDGFEAFAGFGGDGEDFYFGEALLEVFQVFGGFGKVHFVGDDEPRAFGEEGIVEGDFLAEGGDVFAGVADFGAGHVDDEEEEVAAQDVAEEFEAEADVFMGSFDEAGDVGDGDALVAFVFDDADHGMQGGETIGGDFGFGGAEFAQQGAFAGVGEADEAGVGDLPEFEVKHAFLTFDAGSEFGGGAVGGGFEVDVAFAAFAAFCEDEFLADVG